MSGWGDNRSVDETDEPVLIVAVPIESVAELEREGLAQSLPVIRGPVIEAAIAVGVDAAALVTLLQTPATLHSFADWVHGLFVRSGESLELSARRGPRRVKLTVDGDVPVQGIADFLVAAFDESTEAQ